jgi:2-oxoisovalerate dehydrogenase E2 component (dihydrolipoyl transacylase)
MARVPFKLPDIGEGIAEAEIVAWHVAIGDVVEEDAPLADMMTDKATVEMTAPFAGRVVELAGAVGDQIAIGAVLVMFETEEAVETEQAPVAPAPIAHAPEPEPAPAQANSQAAASSRVLASPAVRGRAKALGIDLAQVKPAQGDRVRHADLDAFLRYAAAVPASAAFVPSGEDEVHEVKVVGLRRRIAENMVEAKRNIPHITYVEEIDVTEVEKLRAAMNEGRGARPKLTLLPFLIRAVTRAIADHPVVNARYDDAAGIVRRHSAVHLGLATQTDQGLTVPVIRDAQARDVWQLATEINRLADAARRGKATREELGGSTITISSLGPLGGIVSTPVINRPEVAIVGVNRIVERPAVVDGRIEVRKLMNLSSSFDHRVVDGYDAASFVQALKRRIETPIYIFAD